jgi:branched-subunit amino acid ABC-type transport system permease component
MQRRICRLARDFLAGWRFLGGSPWLGLLVGLLLTAVVAYVLGLLTLGLSGHFLPLGTLAWGLSLYFLFGNLQFLGGHTGLAGIPVLSLFGIPFKDGRIFFYVIWVVVLGAVWLSKNLLDSREGRAIRALKGGVVMAEAMGVDTTRSKTVIFLVAALFSCISGWLYAHMQRFVNPTPFSLHLGIEYLFMAVVGGAGHVWGAIVGAAVITVLKQWLQDIASGLAWRFRQFRDDRFRHHDGPRSAARTRRAVAVADPLCSAGPPGHALSSMPRPWPGRRSRNRGGFCSKRKNIVKRFGGLIANNNLSLSVKAGEVMALIGPNGAGKSTMFNCISGVDSASEGEVLVLWPGDHPDEFKADCTPWE